MSIDVKAAKEGRRELKPWPTPGGITPKRNPHPRDVDQYSARTAEYERALDAFMSSN